MFTAAKSNGDRNLDTLYQYILSRLYDFDFYGKPQQAEKDLLFIPSGFDSLNLIQELCRGSTYTQAADGSELSYEDVIRPQIQALSAGHNQFGRNTQPAV